MHAHVRTAQVYVWLASTFALITLVRRWWHCEAASQDGECLT